ncbi:MAG: hypothetical protein Q7J74_02925 [Pseudomonas sp.]|nr:hypothetical protein [Pseudomonas sp.]
MSLQALYALFNAQPARCLNLLALFLACAGAWLLLATRRREQAAVGSLAMGGEGNAMAALAGEPTQRLNRFFYQFGFACMIGALLLSWGSTQW